MGLWYSITRNPAFQWIALVIGFFLVSTIYVNYKSGGLVSGIMGGLHGAYFIAYATTFVAVLFAIVIWHGKLHIFMEWTMEQI